MTRKLFVVVAVLVPFIAASGLSVIGQAKPSIQGVWRVAEVTTTGPNATTNKNPQAGLYVFTAKHYSIVWDTSDQPRPVLPLVSEGKLSDADMIGRYREWSPVIANSGTYEIKGSQLFTHAVASRNTAVVASKHGLTFDFKVDGNTLWLTLTNLIGDRVQNPATVRLIRAE